MCFCDSPELVDKQIFTCSSPTLYSHTNSSDYDYQKNDQKYSCSSSASNSNDPLKTLCMIKERLKNLDKISRSENCDVNLLNESNINIGNSPSKSPSPQKIKMTKQLKSQSTQSDQQESHFFSDEHLNLFQEIQEENEILKREKEHLTRINEELNNTNIDLAKKQKDYEFLKSEFSNLLSRFGQHNDSKSIIDMFDETQGKLHQISDLLSISPESDPINEINNLIQENKENADKLEKSKIILNCLIDRYKKLVHDSVNSKEEFLSFITESNKIKENQLKNMNIIIYLAIPIMILAITYMITFAAF